jgi:hypothetical protein
MCGRYYAEEYFPAFILASSLRDLFTQDAVVCRIVSLSISIHPSLVNFIHCQASLGGLFAS